MNASYNGQTAIKLHKAHISESSPGLIRPMNWILSLLYFGIPSLLSFLALHVATPFLVKAGMRPYYAQIIPNTFLLGSLFISSFVAYRLEGRPMIWSSMKDRFRLDRMTGKKWLWVIAGTIGGFALYYLASPLGSWLIENGFLPLPASIPAWLDPRIKITFIEKFNIEAGGLHGNWLLFLVSLTTFFFNITGEEFWFRGYILPRQELAFGKWTWLIHAAMWSVLFHAFKYWDIVGLLPAHLVFVYVASRTKSTSVSILLHILTNVAFPIFILLGVLGIGI